ncbi:MAG: beta-galactosidase, partial [Anaerolineae bacterium]|nr:beta-galactosidase [Anaerolineae bacterium]
PTPVPVTPTPTPPPSTSPAKTPTPTPVPAPRPAPAGTGFDYGIQVHPYNVDINQLVSAVQGLGVRWVKFQVPWMWIEPQQGQLNWNAYGLEDAVNAFNNAGIKILLSVVAAPKW